jgi:hypothetical protein
VSTLKASNVQNAGSATVNIALNTSGGVTLGSALGVASGGTGVATITGLLRGNGTSAFGNATRGSDFSLMTVGSAVASTSGTAIDFTGIPSGVMRVTVLLKTVSTSATSALLVQIGSGSFTTTGYACAYANLGGTTTYGNSTSGFQLGINGASANTHSGALTLTLMGSNTWVASGVIGYENQAFVINSAGMLALGGALDRVRVTTTAGSDNFDFGSINILYEY